MGSEAQTDAGLTLLTILTSPYEPRGELRVPAPPNGPEVPRS